MGNVESFVSRFTPWLHGLANRIGGLSYSSKIDA